MDIQTAINRLSALAHPVRLQSFRLLVQAGADGMNAGALADATSSAASSMSFHLKELATAGLVRSTQNGRYVTYYADFEHMQELLTYLTEDCCKGMDCSVSSTPNCAPSCTPEPTE